MSLVFGWSEFSSEEAKMKLDQSEADGDGIGRTLIRGIIANLRLKAYGSTPDAIFSHAPFSYLFRPCGSKASTALTEAFSGARTIFAHLEIVCPAGPKEQAYLFTLSVQKKDCLIENVLSFMMGCKAGFVGEFDGPVGLLMWEELVREAAAKKPS